MKQFNKVKFKLKDAIRLTLLVLCGLIVGVNVYLANANSLVGNQMPMPFGYGAAMVLSGSMEPTFSTGDLIIVKEADNYKEDDIVVFQDGNILVVHRVLQIDGENITTKGDANNAADAPILLSAVKGKVLFWIPYAGYAVEALKTPVGTICVVVLAIALVEIPRRIEQKKDEEERRKILEEIEQLKKEAQQ